MCLHMRRLVDLTISQIGTVQAVIAPSPVSPLEGGSVKPATRSGWWLQGLAGTGKGVWNASHFISTSEVTQLLLLSVMFAQAPLYLRSSADCKRDSLTLLFENTMPLHVKGRC